MIVLLFLQIYFLMETISTGSVVLQDCGFKEAKIGHNVTLRCSCQDEKVTLFTWYQQRLGGTPELISRWVKRSPSPTVMQGFHQRFHIVRSPGEHQTNLLTITALQATDSATYFCGVQVFSSVQFGDGIFVWVRASASYTQSVVQAEASAELGRGKPLELSCAVEAVACSGEKSVYWLKHGASQVIVHPGEDCETLARNCTVRLIIRSVEPTDAGVYYCVLSSCGEILFGNGTEVQITGLIASHALVYWLSTALGLFIVATVALVIVVYNLKRKLSINCQGPVGNVRRCVLAEMSELDIHYAALNMDGNPQPHNEEDKENACTYSSVRSRKL